jgi:hypothetical protein
VLLDENDDGTVVVQHVIAKVDVTRKRRFGRLVDPFFEEVEYLTPAQVRRELDALNENFQNIYAYISGLEKLYPEDGIVVISREEYLDGELNEEEALPLE